jgi:phosphate-selective porin
VPRTAIIIGLMLGLLAGSALAGETSASFSVGVTIIKKGKPPRAATTAKLTYTWGAARISVAKGGFRDIVRQDRASGLYWFVARKGENRFRIAVSATTGTIEKVIPA